MQRYGHFKAGRPASQYYERSVTDQLEMHSILDRQRNIKVERAIYAPVTPNVVKLNVSQNDYQDQTNTNW